MLSQKNIFSVVTAAAATVDFKPDDTIVSVLPIHHTYELACMIAGLDYGMHICINDSLTRVLKNFQIFKPTGLVLVPLFVYTIYKKIWAEAKKSGRDGKLKLGIGASRAMMAVGIDKRKELFADVVNAFGGRLEKIICGGAALNQDIIDTFDAMGITILNGYGITECAPLISCNRNRYQKKGSVGVPIIGEEIKIADPDENGEGEICVKGPNVMLGYYKNPEATAEAFDEEGYFKTGDYGKLDEEGWIYITGRLKNLIIFSNGKNVYPEEIETEISRIRGVGESVVYAGESKANPQKEVIVAEIYPDYDTLEMDGIGRDEEDKIKEYFHAEVRKANSRMVSYKAVGLVKIRKEEFPKNTSRKIMRFAIDKNIDEE